VERRGTATSLDPVAEIVRRRDPDRFLTALFAPAAKRDVLMLLYAFNGEIARAREIVHEPSLALIRLQWWREIVEGATRQHTIATPLAVALAEGRLARAELLSLIDAREAEAQPAIAARTDWLAYLGGTAGGLMVAAARLLEAPHPERLRPAGAAYGVAGVLRATPILARRGRCLLPVDVLAAHRSSPEALIGGAALPSPARDELVAEGWRLLAAVETADHPRTSIAAALPVVLARRDLTRPAGENIERGLADRLAVVQAWWTRRLLPARACRCGIIF
jgi:phytoene synthase